MSEWTWYKLNDFMEFNPVEKIPQYNLTRKIGMEYLQPFNKKISGYCFERFKSGTKFRNGDTLLARITPCLENGKTAYVDMLEKAEIAFGSTEYIVLREKKDISDKQFIYYLSISDGFRDIAIQLMTGSSGRQRIETDALKEKTLLLPLLPEQKAIAEILSSLDDKIELLNRQNKTIEDLAQTYFRQWFVEGKHEEFIAVSDIAILDNEGINPGKKPLELFYHYSIPAFDNAQQPMQELGKAILSNKFKVNPKTILVSKLNPATPRIWIIGNNVLENSVCSTEFQVLKPSDDKYQLFLYFLMKSYNVVSYFSMCTTGTSGSHQRIKPEYILQVEIGKPNEEKLQVYNNIFDDVMLKVQENMKQIQTLQKLRDTLLPKLISGEVQVKM